MLGQRVDIRARCHDCNTTLDFSAHPDAPGPEADGVRATVGEAFKLARRVFGGLLSGGSPC